MSPQFVLKHEALAHLREVALFPNTLNPHEAESLALVSAMVDQVMELHPGARWLHVGCDEVGASPLQQKNSARVERGRPAGEMSPLTGDLRGRAGRRGRALPWVWTRGSSRRPGGGTCASSGRRGRELGAVTFSQLHRCGFGNSASGP